MYTDWKWQYQFFVMRKWLLALLKLSLVASYFYCCYLGWQQLKELPIISFQLSNVNGITLQEIVETMLYLLVAILLVYCFFSWYFGKTEEVTIFIYKVKWSSYPLKITTGFQSPTVESEVMRVTVKGAEENEWNK